MAVDVQSAYTKPYIYRKCQHPQVSADLLIGTEHQSEWWSGNRVRVAILYCWTVPRL